MSLLVTGSIGIDTVTTPFGTSENCLGGSAVYFSLASSIFVPTRFVGAVGNDCPFDLAEVFKGKQIDLAGLEIRKTSKTFRWAGTYNDAMNDRSTDHVELNVLGEDPPAIPAGYKDSKFVFLANAVPAIQQQLLEQLDSPEFVATDTMNFYIDGFLDDLKKLLKKTHCLIINEDEARMLAKETNLIKAADIVLDMGPSVVIIKKGEYGSLMVNRQGEKFLLAAFPATDVKDPTGAGDSFAGGFMGYLAKTGKTDFDTLKSAVAYGTVVASFTVSDFSMNGLLSAKNEDIVRRVETLRKITQF